MVRPDQVAAFVIHRDNGTIQFRFISGDTTTITRAQDQLFYDNFVEDADKVYEKVREARIGLVKG